MRRFAEGRAELPAEMGGRRVSHARERRYIERPRERPIHRIACSQHPPIALLYTPKHLTKRRNSADLVSWSSGTAGRVPRSTASCRPSVARLRSGTLPSELGSRTCRTFPATRCTSSTPRERCHKKNTERARASATLCANTGVATGVGIATAMVATQPRARYEPSSRCQRHGRETRGQTRAGRV